MRTVRKWILALLLLGAIVLDGTCSLYLNRLFNFTVSSSILLVGVILIGLLDDINEKEVWLALGAGIVADLFNFGFLGIYTFFLPIICWLSQKIARYWPEIWLARLMVAIGGTVLFDAYTWLIFNATGIISTSVKQLLMSIPGTIGSAIIFFVVSYWLWERMIRNYPFLVDLSAYRQ